MPTARRFADRIHATLPEKSLLATDIRASIVVFLVALPLCLGVAIASGAPPATGLITGIVGGLLVGLLPGSKLQVSGPAAGLVVLVYDLIESHGIEVLGPVVLLAGLIQLALATLKLGRWFRAIALPVVHGMLAGIGLLIVMGQILVVLGAEGTGSGPSDLQALPGAFTDAIGGPGGVEHTLFAGALGLAILVAWRWAPSWISWLPGPLVAVIVTTLAVIGAGWDAPRIELPGNFFDAIAFPSADGISALTEPAVLGLAVALAVIASAESLLSAVAVDRMHDGEPTRFNQELASQGVGNSVAGVLGGLPMTAVIVRSTANVNAGATTKVSRVLHGFWLLLFAAALPFVLSEIPTAALAAVLISAGAALMKPANIKRLAGEGRSELVIYAVTVIGVFAVGLLEGVIIGLLLAGALLLRQLTGMRTRREADGDTERVVVEGPATFVGVPKLADALEEVPDGKDVEVSFDEAPIVDPAARDLVEGWKDRHEAKGGSVELKGHERDPKEEPDPEPDPA